MTSPGALSLDDIELEPTLEELDVPIGSVSSRRSRSVPIVVGLLGALVGWGFVGRIDEAPDEAPATPTAIGAPNPHHRVAPPAGAPHGGVVLTMPEVDARLSAGVVSVAGSAPSGSGPLAITIALGDVILGEAVVDPVEGAFAVPIRVLAPRRMAPIPVSIRVARASEPGTVLAERHARLLAAGAAVVDEAIRTHRGGRPVVEVHGTAAMGVQSLVVTVISSAGRSTVEALVTPVRDPLLAAAARLFVVGEWTATLPAPPVQGDARVVVRWADGSPAGGVSSLDLETP